MPDFATPNLPSREFKATSRFYGQLGFLETWRDAGWMILKRGDLTLEFFPFPDLDPATSSFSCCFVPSAPYLTTETSAFAPSPKLYAVISVLGTQRLIPAHSQNSLSLSKRLFMSAAVWQMSPT